MRLVQVKNAKPGDFLANNILDETGRILLKEGVLLTDPYLLKIKRLKIPSIYIKIQHSDAVDANILEIKSQQAKRKKIYPNFEAYSLYSKNSDSKNLDLTKDDASNEIASYLKSIENSAKNIINEIRGKKNVMQMLSVIKNINHNTYQHSVHVAQYSLVIGVQLHLSPYELYTLCIGALLHDIGKVLIPKGLILKLEPLSDEEFETVKRHTINGYAYLKGCLDVSDSAKIIAIQHHERIDGRGYPNKIKGESLNKFSKIVAIADVYDSLTSDRSYRNATSPHDAIKYLLERSGTQFDGEMVKVFSTAIVPYPSGTLLELSNGNIAIVTTVLRNFALRPQVQIIKKGTTPNSQTVGETVSLMERLDIEIERIRYLA